MHTELEDVAAARLRLFSPDEQTAILVACGVSDSAVAREMGNVTRVTVGRWRRGEATPRGRHAVEYLRLLDRLVALLDEARHD